MTAEQIRRLRKSFCQVERKADIAAPLFYQQLFAMDAGLRPFFKTDVELQEMKLMEMLGEALDLLERPIELEAALAELGARHTAYGLGSGHYAKVGTALIAMLESVLGKDFSLEIRQAWVALYHLVAGKLVRGAVHATC